MLEYINNITETLGGYPIRDLKWNARDNIIVGFVKDPIWGKEGIRNGFISCTWRKNGSCLKDKNRLDLRLKINY